jgi:hypothetical protein
MRWPVPVMGASLALTVAVVVIEAALAAFSRGAGVLAVAAVAVEAAEPAGVAAADTSTHSVAKRPMHKLVSIAAGLWLVGPFKVNSNGIKAS